MDFPSLVVKPILSGASSVVEFDKDHLRHYYTAVMSLLRTPIFSAVMALFLLCGYSAEIFGGCPEENDRTHLQEMAKGKVEGDCQCACHFGYVYEPVLLPEWSEKLFATGQFYLVKGEFPPDALPAGIDYPPQLS